MDRTCSEGSWGEGRFNRTLLPAASLTAGCSWVFLGVSGRGELAAPHREGRKFVALYRSQRGGENRGAPAAVAMFVWRRLPLPFPCQQFAPCIVRACVRAQLSAAERSLLPDRPGWRCETPATVLHPQCEQGSRTLPPAQPARQTDRRADRRAEAAFDTPQRRARAGSGRPGAAQTAGAGEAAESGAAAGWCLCDVRGGSDRIGGMGPDKVSRGRGSSS